MKKAIDRIAREILRLETLETRRRDRLDFHDLAVQVANKKTPSKPPTRLALKVRLGERRLSKELKS